MPTAGDAFLTGQLPAQNNPLIRLSSTAQAPVFDLTAFLNQWTTFFTQYGFPIIKQLTGIDLTALGPILKDLTSFIPGLGSGNITTIASDFINLILNPTGLLGSLNPNQLISLFTGAISGLTGLTGLGSIFTDITGLLGGPTSLGSGSPVLPGIGSIPLLGGLLGGGNILGSLIPGLDASKIISGTFPLSMITSLTTLLGGFGSTTSILTQLIGLFTGTTSGLTGLTGLGNIFTDMTKLMGAPTSLGSGSPVLPGISSIPLLGGLLSGGNILGSIIPGLDASKIISGSFPMSMITSLTTLLGGFGTTSSILTQLIGLFTGTTTGLTGTTGLGNIFNDITHLLGSPTSLGSGTPVLPGISSIPVLGGLLSGGNILSSIIPGLDASKIVSGAFPMSMITSLSTLLGGFGTTSSILTQLIGLFTGTTTGLTGTAGLGNIFNDITHLMGGPTSLGSGSPVLPGISSIPLLGGLLSGGNILGSIIPGLDASKIISGSFPMSMITSLTTLLGGFGTTTSILTQLIGLFTGTTTGLTGTTGLGNIFNDITKLIGSPTSLGSGSPVLPGISSIPVLGGLLSGGLILGSIIPGLDASKITSGLFGSSLIPNISAGTGAGKSVDLQTVIDGISQAANNNTTTGNATSTVLPSIQAIPSNIFNSIMGQTGTWANSDAGNALTSQTTTVKGNSAQLAQLQAAMAKGTSDSDAFERTSSTSLGTAWNQYYSGTGITLATSNGHDASMSSGLGTAECVAYRNATHSSVDNQVVQSVLASSASSFPFPSAIGYNDVWCRMSAFTTWATRTGVRMRWGANSSLKLSAFVNGTETVLWTGTAAAQPASGAAVELDAGQGTATRRFVAKINGIVCMDFTETGTTSQLGASYRNWGFGGRSEASGLIEFYPGNVSQWTAQDGQ